VRKIQRLAAIGAMAVLIAAAGACSTAQEPAPGGQAGQSASSSVQAAPNPNAPTPSGTGVTQPKDVFGPVCDALPKQGPGSPQDTANEPVATAATHIPMLTTFVKALTAAKLDDTLNNAPALTVFAPSDAAFKVLDVNTPGVMNQLTTAPDSTQITMLKYHVVGQRYDAAGLVQAGTLDSLEGHKIKIGGTATAPTVNGAQVMCGNIPTKNTTVFIITQVLSPPAA
jgi:uncharacterized surface protein with fasciclin (FAS1) repeats